MRIADLTVTKTMMSTVRGGGRGRVHRGPRCIMAACFVLIGTVTGCGRGGSPSASPAPEAPVWSAIPAAARLYYDNSGGVRDSLRLVIRDASTMQEVWARATSSLDQPPAVPFIDFDTDMLLLVAAGRKTAEEQIRVDSVSVRQPSGVEEEMLFAIVRLTEGCQRFNIEAFPLEIVRVRRFDGPVEFVERRERPADCGAGD